MKRLKLIYTLAMPVLLAAWTFIATTALIDRFADHGDMALRLLISTALYAIGGANFVMLVTAYLSLTKIKPLRVIDAARHPEEDQPDTLQGDLPEVPSPNDPSPAARRAPPPPPRPPF